MSDPFGHHNNFLPQIPDNTPTTHLRSSLSLDSSNSRGTYPTNNNSNVDINLTLNSGASFPTQNQVNPLSGQLRLSLNSNSNFPAHTSHFRPMQLQNAFNINIVMGNNSSININIPNNNSPSQFTIHNRFASSFSYTPDQNNVINAPSSNSPQLLLSFNQEPLTSNRMENNENPQFTTINRFASSSSYTPNRNNVIDALSSKFPQVLLPFNQETLTSNFMENIENPPLTLPYTQDSSPRITTMCGNHRHTSDPSQNQEFPAYITSLGQNEADLSLLHRQVFLSSQSIHSQENIISQRTSNLSLLSLSSRHFPRENHNDFTSFQNSNMNLTDEESMGFNDRCGEYQFHPIQSRHTLGKLTQAEHPDLEALAQMPNQNDNIQQRQAGGRRLPETTRGRSHPYVKNGPYTCPKCHETYENAQRYAGHVHGHYKGESPKERRKRRESKFRRKDLHIAQSPAGITIMPGSPSRKERSHVSSNTGQGEGSSGVRIKEEIDSDSDN